MFGHERGAFTGADRQKRGLLESADGGTVFLDEIGEMVPALQAKLLRFLEEKTFKRVGGSVDLRVDVRVIAATKRNLQEEVRHGRFREDLFYRLNVLPIVLPPLRERGDDIPLLVHYYIDSYNTEFKKRVRGIDLEQLERSLVVQALERTGWNQTRAAALLGVRTPISLDDRLRDVEANLIGWALKASNGNKSRAAELLQIKRSTLGDRIKHCGLDRVSVQADP